MDEKTTLGGPPFVPTDDERAKVEKMAAVGIPQESIARCVRDGGIDAKTLRKHFREELDTAHTRATANVAGMLYNNAMAGDFQAQKFWMGTKGGWVIRTEVSGKDGGPIEYKEMSDHALDAKLAMLKKQVDGEN